MKWVKANWLIIVLTVVALAALPSMFYVSNKLDKSLRAKVFKDVADDYKAVSDSQVTYSIKSVKQPDTNLLEKKTSVNAILTKAFADARTAITSASAKIGDEAVKFNQGNHKPLVDGVFPKPSDDNKYVTPLKFATAFIETGHKALIALYGGGMPVPSASLAATLDDYKKARSDRLKSVNPTASLTPEDEAKLNQELLEQRLGRYMQHASEISFYADPVQTFPEVPTAVPNPLPPLSRMWDWQMRYWIHGDILRAITEANKVAGGGTPSVLTGAVKRVIRMSVSASDFQDIDDATPEAALGEGAAVTPPHDPVTPDMTFSLTGRTSGPNSANGYYDLRKVTLEVIVAPEKLPMFFDAMAAVNFMTVLQCDMERLEADAEMRDGFYYGNDHVVKATMVIETLWLRSWTKQYMPKTVKAQLGVTDDKPAEQPAASGDQPK